MAELTTAPVILLTRGGAIAMLAMENF
jgi:hypothetical protein